MTENKLNATLKTVDGFVAWVEMQESRIQESIVRRTERDDPIEIRIERGSGL